MDALKAGQGADGSTFDAWVGEVEFDDLVAGETGFVNDVDGDGLQHIRTGLCFGDDGIGVGENGIGEAEAEGVEGSFVQVAIGAVEHGIVGERRELGYGFIESDGKTAGGIVVAGENIGHGGAAFFAGIPGFENGSGVIVGPIDGEGGAAGEDDDQRLAGSGEGLEKLLLRSGQSDVGPITAEEAGVAVLGLFAFELCGDADDGDDDIGFAGDVDGFLLEIGRKPEKADGGFPGSMKIFEGDWVRMSGLKMNEGGEGAFAVGSPLVD